MGFNPLVLDTLNTIQVAASLGPGSFGAYVISQATCASDVLAVMLLQVSKYVIRERDTDREIYRYTQRKSVQGIELNWENKMQRDGYAKVLKGE